MQAIPLALLATTSGAIGTTPPTLEFSTPAHVVGDFEAAGAQWAVLVYDSGSSLDFDLQHVDQVVRHDLLAQSDAGFEPIKAPGTTVVPLFNTTDFPQSDAVGHAQATGRSFLLIQADSIDFQLPSSVHIHAGMPNMEMGRYLFAASQLPPGTYRETPNAAAEDVALTVEPRSDLRLLARGVTHMEWTGVEVQCNTNYCPPGGQPTHIADTARTSTDILSFIELHSKDGTVTLTGQPFSMAAGGRELDVEASGYFRLPQASMQGACGPERCPDPDGKTFRLNGTLILAGLHRIQEGRLATHATGQLDAAGIDETPIPGFSTSRAAAATAAAVGLLLLLKLAWAVFFTRHRRPALEHPRVRAIYEAIVAQPGLKHTDLMRLTGEGNGNLVRYVRRLADEQLVFVREYRTTQRYYEKTERNEKDWRAYAVLQDERNRALHDWLLQHPDASQHQVIQSLPDLTRRKILHALDALEEAGLIEGQRRSIWIVYHAKRFPESNASLA